MPEAIEGCDHSGAGFYDRVRVGPFAKPEDMNRARNQLAQNGIQASVVKARESAATP